MIREAISQWLLNRGFLRSHSRNGFHYDHPSVTVYVDDFDVNIYYPRHGAVISDAYVRYQSDISLSVAILFSDPDLFAKIEELIK